MTYYVNPSAHPFVSIDFGGNQYFGFVTPVGGWPSILGLMPETVPGTPNFALDTNFYTASASGYNNTTGEGEGVGEEIVECGGSYQASCATSINLNAWATACTSTNNDIIKSIIIGIGCCNINATGKERFIECKETGLKRNRSGCVVYIENIYLRATIRACSSDNIC